jgi:hypothetical protein
MYQQGKHIGLANFHQYCSSIVDEQGRACFSPPSGRCFKFSSLHPKRVMLLSLSLGLDHRLKLNFDCSDLVWILVGGSRSSS